MPHLNEVCSFGPISRTSHPMPLTLYLILRNAFPSTRLIHRLLSVPMFETISAKSVLGTGLTQQSCHFRSIAGSLLDHVGICAATQVITRISQFIIRQ